MCGRYAASHNPDDLVAAFEATDATDDAAPGPDYNVAPTDPVLGVLTRRPRGADEDAEAVRQVRVLRWGLVPSWSTDAKGAARMINARAESIADKPAFKRALASRRCLLPADGWYEWQRAAGGPGKQAYFMTRRHGGLLAMAGLYEFWSAKGSDDVLLSCSVVTTAAVGPLTEIHDRMPLVLGPGDWSDWLDPARAEVPDLLEPPSEALVETLELRPVGPAVGNVANDGPGLTERVGAELDRDTTLF